MPAGIFCDHPDQVNSSSGTMDGFQFVLSNVSAVVMSELVDKYNPFLASPPLAASPIFLMVQADSDTCSPGNTAGGVTVGGPLVIVRSG